MKLDNKTQFFRPLETPVDNFVSYYVYSWQHHKNWVAVVKLALFAIAVVGFVGDITDFITGTLTARLITIGSFLLANIFTIRDFVKNYDNRFTSVESEPGVYDDVQPHDVGWERIDLKTSKGLEPVFRSDRMDDLLISSTPIPMKRDEHYEKRLRNRIQNEDTWNGVYGPFLTNNYRAAMYSGKQFYNEKKYGLSQPIDLKNPVAKVHKTCYFDTYLTNIIPGQKLTYNKTGELAADATGEDFLPYRTDSSGERHLYYIGEKYVSNELGVTTLLITRSDHILLWRQNRLAQCSTDLIVASGSGSADWDDCKNYFNDPDGFRKAVIHGMEREMWEESNGTREAGKDMFLENVETRITGYFRWLKKGGKSEFVGVSRLKDSSLIGLLSPEVSEVVAGTELDARTIKELIASIDGEVYGAGSDYEARRSSVSCAMALYSLRRLCDNYCKTCPHYDAAAGKCTTSCTEKPYDVLF